MGVSGSGKTTVAEGIAEQLRWRFLEGDDLHPPANVEKMARGEPLTDADRGPWLEAIGRWIDARASRPARARSLTCSALRRSYRDRLRAGRPDAARSATSASAETLRERLGDTAGRALHAGVAAAEPARDPRAAGCRRAGDRPCRRTRTPPSRRRRGATPARSARRARPDGSAGDRARSISLCRARVPRAHSSAGRAPPLQGGCQGFESLCAHRSSPAWRRPAACWARTHGAHRPIVGTRTPHARCRFGASPRRVGCDGTCLAVRPRRR